MTRLAISSRLRLKASAPTTDARLETADELVPRIAMRIKFLRQLQISDRRSLQDVAGLRARKQQGEAFGRKCAQ